MFLRMRECKHCGRPTTNAKFCSQSCAASFNNRGVSRYPPRPPRPCRHCAKQLKTHQYVYCSEACSQSARRADVVARWLTTGQIGGSAVNRSIRAYVLAEQNGCCALCGMEPEWQGAPLVFVLDHVDGNSSDNSRANVRLICPNCDSQLPTYKARNRGNGRYARRIRYANGQSF